MLYRGRVAIRLSIVGKQVQVYRSKVMISHPPQIDIDSFRQMTG
jgi:hypothetical protein